MGWVRILCCGAGHSVSSITKSEQSTALTPFTYFASDYWGYFEPIRQFMPQNCSADVEAVIAHFDQVFTDGTQSQINALKNEFGMGAVTHLDDVTGACASYVLEFLIFCLLDSTFETQNQYVTICGTGNPCNRLQVWGLSSSDFVMHWRSRTESTLL